MKKLLPVLITTLLFAGVITATHIPTSHPKAPSLSSAVFQPENQIKHSGLETAYAKEEAPQYSPPKILTIPKIGLNTNVISVGLDTQNRMDVPNNFVDAGWYNLGPMPGQTGSVVIDGHSDDFRGNPAVFYYLKDLALGDQIIVTDQVNKQYTYIVSDIEIYPYTEVPLQQIFDTRDKARLNLITCHGEWDNTINTYNQRIVIYSELQL